MLKIGDEPMLPKYFIELYIWILKRDLKLYKDGTFDHATWSGKRTNRARSNWTVFSECNCSEHE